MLELQAASPVSAWPASRWPTLLEDAAAFCARWVAQAHSLGWQAWELFGCHRRAPWHRIDGMGLVLALNGRELVALTSGEVVIRAGTGNCLTHRRRPCDPLWPADRTLIWELVP